MLASTPSNSTETFSDAEVVGLDGLEAFDHFMELLGPRVCLVPIEPRTKRPKHTYAERPFEAFQTEAWRAQFVIPETGIAIKLGETSGHICAIDLDCKDGDDYAEFLNANPGLEYTLRTKGARGGQIFIRVQGPYPASAKTDRFEWRAEGCLSQVHGVHPSGVKYQILCSDAPQSVDFNSIVWPENWSKPWEKTAEDIIVEEYGWPIYVPAKGPPRFSEDALVKKFLLENKVLYEPDTNRLYFYDPSQGLWYHKHDEAVHWEIGNAIRGLASEMKANAGGDTRYDAVLPMITASLKTRLLISLRGATAHKNAFAARKASIVHVANGMLDLSSGRVELKPFGPEHMSRNQSPLKYDPQAKCPRFLGELIGRAVKPEDADVIRRYGGLALLGKNLCQVVLVFSGIGRTSKGTTASLIQEIVGKINCFQLRTGLLDSRFETGLFHDRTLLYGADVAEDFLNNESAGRIKSLTGGDLLIGEVKGGNDSHQIRGEFNVLITANTRLMLKLSGDASAYSRRLILIIFENAVDEPIPNFDKILIEQEGSGILNWFLSGALEMLECIANRQPFPLTPEQKMRVEDLLNESDSLRHFVDNCIHRTGMPTDGVTTIALHRAYMEHCDTKAWQPIGKKTFEGKIPDLICERHKSHKQRHLGGSSDSPSGYQGIVLLSESEAPE
jgi:phage/plasmid-associated DNA primase